MWSPFPACLSQGKESFNRRHQVLIAFLHILVLHFDDWQRFYIQSRLFLHYIYLCCHGSYTNSILPRNQNIEQVYVIFWRHWSKDSFIQTLFIAPVQVHFYSEALPTQHGYCAGVSRRSATDNCELRTYPRSLRGG